MVPLKISPQALEDFSKKYRGARVLLTGGTGFLGKRIAPALEQAKCEVFRIGTKDCDLRDYRQVLACFSKKYDLVIHGAAVQGGLEFILSNPTRIFVENQLIHTNIISACEKYPPKKLIGIGTSCSYPGNQSDMREDDFWNGRLEESVFTYGFTKKALYVGQYALYQEKKIPGAHIVLNNLYGPEDNVDPLHAHAVVMLIAKFHQAKKNGTPVSVWGDGSAERELLYIDDAVEGILRGLTVLDDRFELLNIATGRSTKIKALAETIAEVYGYHNIFYDVSKPAGAKLKSLSHRKCREMLHWIPETSLEEGIRNTVKWYEDAFGGGS